MNIATSQPSYYISESERERLKILSKLINLTEYKLMETS